MPARGLMSMITFTLLALGIVFAFRASLDPPGQIYYGLSSLVITTGMCIWICLTLFCKAGKATGPVVLNGCKVLTYCFLSQHMTDSAHPYPFAILASAQRFRYPHTGEARWVRWLSRGHTRTTHDHSWFVIPTKKYMTQQGLNISVSADLNTDPLSERVGHLIY